jgi:chorismate mutase
MQSLRRQVDRIDLKMLQLLQQRTKLSGRIGEMKRRHGAVVYVPERERELVARLTRVSKGQPPARVVAALYREILSSSRAAQGQAPIGLLKASATNVLPEARASFGACDAFQPQKTWTALMHGVDTSVLSLALVTGDDLLKALEKSRWRTAFQERFTVAGELAAVMGSPMPLARKIFIITPRRGDMSGKGERIVILIECKSAVNALKRLFPSMPDFAFSIEHLTRSIRGGDLALARLTMCGSADASGAAGGLLTAAKTAGLSLAILGSYHGAEGYGG